MRVRRRVQQLQRVYEETRSVRRGWALPHEYHARFYCATEKRPCAEPVFIRLQEFFLRRSYRASSGLPVHSRDGKRASGIAAFACEFENAEGAQAILPGDGVVLFAEQSVAHGCIEFAIVAGQGGNAAVAELDGFAVVGGGGERAPLGFGIREPERRIWVGGEWWARAADEGGLLRIQAVFAEAAVGPVDEGNAMRRRRRRMWRRGERADRDKGLRCIAG